MSSSANDSPRVLVVCNMWPVEEAPTRGIFVQEQVESLRARGLQVDTLYVDTRPSPALYATLLPRLAAALRETRPALIHAHYGLVGAAISPWRWHPLIVTFHGSDVYIPWQRRLSRVAAGAASERIFVSRSLREAMGVQGEVVTCGIDTKLFSMHDRAWSRDQMGLDPKRRTLLFPASRDNPAKGWPLLQAALARLPFEVQVVELHKVPRSKVPILMSAVDLLAVTSRYEGGPIVVKEALACGLPVVSVPVGDTCERLEGLSGCALVPRDPVALAAAIQSMLQTPTRLDARERVEDFSHASVAASLEALYVRVLDSWRLSR